MGTVATVMASNSGPSVQSSQAGQCTIQRANYELTGTQAEDDTLVIRLLKLPAGHRMHELIVDVDDLDEGAAGEIEIGIEDTIQDPADTTDQDEFAAGLSIQAASTNRYVGRAVQELAAVPYDRFITAAIATAAATGAAGGIAATLVSYPELGSQFDGNAS